MNLDIVADKPTVTSSEGIGELAKALAAAQAVMQNPEKDAVNPHFKSRYADLATVRNAVLPVLNRHGLSVVQLPCETEKGPALVSLLLHQSGEWVGCTLLLRATKTDPQGIGSALTYARRYALQSLAGVAADDDDDGEAGSRPRPSPAPDPRPAPPPVSPPLAPQNTHAQVERLVGAVATLLKLEPHEVFHRLCAAAAWEGVTGYADLTQTQVTQACAALRAKLAPAAGKAGA